MSDTGSTGTATVRGAVTPVRTGGRPPGARPVRSWTSVRRNGTRITGAGSTSGPGRRGAPPPGGPPARSRRGCGRGRRGRCRRACSARSRSASGSSSVKCGCMRFTISAAHRDVGLGQLVGEERGLGDGVALGRRPPARTTVAGVGQQLEHLLGPVLEPCSMPSKAWKKVMASSNTSPPTTLRHAAHEGLGGHVHRLHRRPRVGAIEHPVEAVVEEAGEAPGRVEEVEGVAARRGVDDDEVEVARRRAARRASPSPCTPACPTARRRCSGRSGWRGSARPAPGRRSSVVTRSSKVRLGVEHQRPQLAGPGAVDAARACCRCRRGRGRRPAAWPGRW